MIDFNEKPMTSKAKAKALSLVCQVLDYGKENKDCDRCLTVEIDEGLGIIEVAFFERDSEGNFKTADYRDIHLREDRYRTFHEIIQRLDELSNAMEKFHNGENWKKGEPK